MLVYGDRERTADPHEAMQAITASLRAVEIAPPGPERHDRLTLAFLQASGLAQGLADAEFAERGFDDRSPVQDTAMALLVTLARKLAASAWSGFASAGPAVAPELMALAILPLPEAIRLRELEGYAFYAVYPESYLKACAEHPWTAPPLVIGLRSIGAGLAALAAVASKSDKPVTVRPCGDPFHRRLKVSERLRAELAAHVGPFAIVDEGPGLSGSSFRAAADLLGSLGVAAERMVFVPSHAEGPGWAASADHRACWARSTCAVASFERLLEDDPLTAWFTDITGPIAAVEDLSGGAWRTQPRDGPPVNRVQERLKFRLRTASGNLLARFAGLGAIGEAKFGRARELHAAGFTPEPLALRRGFLIERWESGSPGAGIARRALIEHLGRYLGFRAAAFAAAPEDGADLAGLAQMVRVNVGELLGPDAAKALGARFAACAARASRPRPIHIDGRLQAWEWLVTPDGRLLKTDALDHSQVHDLVGCQDVAWDVAGARAEFDLTDAEAAELCAAVEAACGRAVDPALLEAYEIAYCAFQAGYWTMAHASAAPDDQPGVAAQTLRYRGRLAGMW